MARSTNVDALQRVIDHVFLPPKLPLQADEASELALIDTGLEALNSLGNTLLPDLVRAALGNAVILLTNLKAINSRPGGKTDETELRRILTALQPGQTLAVKVSAQNTAILVTRQSERLDSEEFELSPQNKAVIETKGRLGRTFPGLAVAVNADLLTQSDYFSMVASTIATMCHQKVPGMQPKSKKAGSDHDEHRDTAKPAMISELIFGVLRGIGGPISVSTIMKHTRDEVLYDRAEAPWRRSPMWLLIRVALQLVISRYPGGSYELYKEIMVVIMTEILEKASHLPTDTIFVMRAKIHWRLQKLSQVERAILPGPVFDKIESTLRHATDTTSARWTTVQRQDARDIQLDDLATLDFEGDTLVALPKLDEYIHATSDRQRESRHPCFLPSSQIITYAPDGLPNLPGSNSEDPSYAAANLMKFEQWVAKRVECWVATYSQASARKKLHGLMLRYHALASAYYSGNPEAVSVMVLVIFELWVACDKVAVRIGLLIGKFDPGIPPAIIQNLLLPYLEQMARLSRVENYLETRRSDSTESTDRMFDTRSGMSYASLYYDKSLPHQQLLSTTELDANTSREAKRDELRDVKADYRRIDRLLNQTDHQYTIQVIDNWCNPLETETVHSCRCQKCDYQTQRESLSIAVHEWPLPCDPFEAKAVVFELRVPLWFGHWRDFRFDLLEAVLKGERDQVRAESRYKPSTNDPHLRRYFKSSSSQRIGLTSVVKPVSSTHYKSKNITTLIDTQICVRNGLQCRYYDATSDAYMGSITFKDVIPLACTYKLPCQALRMFTSIAARVLSLSASADVQNECLAFLKRARAVAMR